MFSDEHYNSAHIIHVHNNVIHFVLMNLVIFLSYLLIVHVIISYYILMYISYDFVRIKLPRTQYRSESTCQRTQHGVGSSPYGIV